ncbi:MAG: sensor domain-containing diguanylate cyclase [Candidatus Omnitrophica bacterium]|nr:sensor domain-containing diguanylate cyclase [Candidatus Omnitrophota bacterium]
MDFLIYFIITILVLSLSYRIRLSHTLIFSVLLGVFIMVRAGAIVTYETMVFVLFINAIPFIADRFKKDFASYKEGMHLDFDKVKREHEDLMGEDRHEIESNLEREKKLQQVLSLYEISKDMSTCLLFEDIFSIFSSTLKRSFRFRLSRLVLLKESKDIDRVYQIELGHKINNVAPDDFDREIAKVALETRKPILISLQEGSDFLRRLSVVRDFETLVSIPLFVEERVVGILYVENLPRPHFENFIILAGQFAIQFQKVVLYKKVQESSITDSLTGVSTRRYFLERFSEEIRRSMRHKTNMSFLMLDLDHFKETNDKFGHLVGDVVLKEVAAMLKANLREIDIIGRYGGEEFIVALSGTGRDGAFQVAGRIREGVEDAIFKAYDEVVSSTVSIGVAVFPDDGADLESLIESADKALYKAKETGRNRIC